MSNKPDLQRQALMKIRDEFSQIPLPKSRSLLARWNSIPIEVDRLLSQSLLLLCKSASCDRAAAFLLDEEKDILVARQVVDQEDVMPGEEELTVAGSPLQHLLDGQKPFWTTKSPYPVVYLPLRAFGSSFGIVRVERVKPSKDFTADEQNFLKEFTHELATSLRGLQLATFEASPTAQLQALSDVSHAIFRSLRMDEMLQSVTQSLIYPMGFDRAKVYLINKEGDALTGVWTSEEQHLERVQNEHYPLRKGVHPMVDLILGKTDDQRIERFQQTIVYLPLRIRDENLGVLMVDNLLSQQEISQEKITVLNATAGQLALAIKNARLFQGVEELSITDGLTGLYLQRYFKQRLKEEFFRAERSHSQLSMMILDIDHFKRVNDTFGHPAGDTILATVAERILSNARKVDLTARYGGDEFIILLPDTSAEEAMLLAERLHQAVSKEFFTLADGTSIHLTVSIGIATYPTHASTIEELIKRSDEALYWIKSHGRNRIRLYSPDIRSRMNV